MRPVFAAALLTIIAAPLAACGGKGDDRLAEKVEDGAENRADAMEQAADRLEERAEQTRENGEARADAIDAADVNAAAMSDEQKAAIIANDAAAVR